MRERDKIRCWKQILETMGIDAMEEEEWAHAYQDYMRSWRRTYYIRHTRSDLLPLRNHMQQRPIVLNSAPSSSSSLPTAAAASSSVASAASPMTPQAFKYTGTIPKRLETIATPTSTGNFNDSEHDPNKESGSKLSQHREPSAPSRGKISSLIRTQIISSDESGDDLDESLPLAEWQKRAQKENQVKGKEEPVAPVIFPIKRKRGRPSLAEKAQREQLQAAYKAQELPSSSKNPSLVTHDLSEEKPKKKEKVYHNPLIRASQKHLKAIEQQYRRSPKTPGMQQATPSKQKATPSHQKATPSQQQRKTIQIIEESPQRMQPNRSQRAANLREDEFARSSPLAKKRTQASGLVMISEEGTPMPAHMPPTPMNLICQPNNEQQKEKQKQEEDDECAAENLHLTENIPERCESRSSFFNSILNDHNYNLIDGNAMGTCDLKMEDLLLDDPMVMADPAVENSFPIIEEFKFPEENVVNNVDVFNMDLDQPMLEVDLVDSKSPIEIHQQMAGTSDFFDKLPVLSTVEVDKSHLVGLIAAEPEELDYEDDDDVLSVATSWDGLDDEMFQNQPPTKGKTKSNNKVETVEVATNSHTATEPKPEENQETRSAETATRSAHTQSKISAAKPKPNEKQVAIPTATAGRPSATETSAPPKPKTGEDKDQAKSGATTENQKGPFRIPKVSQTQLEAQPSVMKMLYDQQEKEKKEKARKPEPTQPPVPSTSKAVNRQREEATAARHSKVKTPVFGPLYQTTAPVSQGSSAPFQEIPPRMQESVLTNNWMTDVYGIKCLQFLDDRCTAVGCSHEMSSVGEVQRRLMQMDESILKKTYCLSLRSIVIFKNYFVSFAEIFVRRNHSRQVLQMISDCRFYKHVAGPLIGSIFGILQQCGMEKEMARVLMTDLWMPNKAHKFRPLTISILEILSKTNWLDYVDQIFQLGIEYKFCIPMELVYLILEAAKDSRQELAHPGMLLMINRSVVELQNPKAIAVLTTLVKNSPSSANLPSIQHLLSNQNGQSDGDSRAALDARPGTSPSLISGPNQGVVPGSNRWMGLGSFDAPPPAANMQVQGSYGGQPPPANMGQVQGTYGGQHPSPNMHVQGSYGGHSPAPNMQVQGSYGGHSPAPNMQVQGSYGGHSPATNMQVNGSYGGQPPPVNMGQVQGTYGGQQPLPNMHVPPPAVNMGQAPGTYGGQQPLPNMHVPPPAVNMGQAPGSYGGQQPLPNMHVPPPAANMGQAPGSAASMGQAPGSFMGPPPATNVGQAPGSYVGYTPAANMQTSAVNMGSNHGSSRGPTPVAHMGHVADPNMSQAAGSSFGPITEAGMGPQPSGFPARNQSRRQEQPNVPSTSSGGRFDAPFNQFKPQ
ncbi:uncharacterized protein Dana_GF15157, isoform F [Drosophila ananassae]|uniref:Uncharacterized protein, isoform F n=1 Tax=Drosophila ananassae TaxID=7217 RepID=A0A0P9BN11_DROAN|nr:protein deadlock isoform X2 [Drosophila ananassae]KPU73195.1 uncharacterized protein Dana_GF15157, isoform F [Drosophila ananassae]